MISSKIIAQNPAGAIIGYKNLLSSTTTAIAEAALTPNTWERYRDTAGTKTIKFQLGAAADIDFIAVAGHNLSGETFNLQVAATIGGAGTKIVTLFPDDNAPIFVAFTAQSVAEVIFNGTFAGAIEIAVIYAGKYLQMPTGIYGGHSPITLSAKTEYQSNTSETGQFLGRNITKQGQESSFSWKYLDPYWYREYFKLFVESARIAPFFISWRPNQFTEIAFGYVDDDITPKNMGGGSGLMDVDFKMKAHRDL